MTIKELRKNKGLTQRKLAESLGVSPVTISAIEGGRLAVSAKLAGKIREVYGVEVEEAEKKTAVKRAEKAPEKKLVKKVSTPKLEIYIQSPLGGNITPEQIEAKMPEGTESAFVRVDQNLIWWVRGEETGAVEIWADER